MTEEQAKTRLLLLTLVKLLAAGMIIFGLGNIMKPTLLLADADIGRMFGVLLMLVGVADLLIAPKMLKRSWDKQDKL
jgi:hypothetical protein